MSEEKISIQAFIESQKIRPSLAAGFSEHMKRYGSQKFASSKLHEEFCRFAGQHPDGTCLRSKPKHTTHPARTSSEQSKPRQSGQKPQKQGGKS
jgi:hypothetical protein